MPYKDPENVKNTKKNIVLGSQVLRIDFLENLKN